MNLQSLAKAFFLIGILILGVFLLLRDSSESSNSFRPELESPIDPSRFEPQLPGPTSANRGEILSESLGALGRISGVVIPAKDAPLTSGMLVRLLRVSWPDRLVGKQKMNSLELVESVSFHWSKGSVPWKKDLQNVYREVTRMVCSPEGEFSFEGLGPGDYFVCAGQKQQIWSPARKKISLGEATGWEGNCEIPLQPTKTISVQVLSNSEPVAEAQLALLGEIVDRTALPQSLYMTPQEVWLYLLNEPFVGGVTDINGRYIFESLPRIPYHLHARMSGVGMAQTFVSVETSNEQILELEVGGSLAGVVTDEEGNPVEGARVEISFDEEMGLEYVIPRNDVLTDSEGFFLFEAMKPGEYKVEVKLSGFQGKRLSDLVVLPGRKLFEEIVLDFGHVISGRLISMQGDPVQGKPVRLSPGGGEEVISDAQGFFLFNTLRQREYKVAVRGACTLHSSTSVQVDGPPLEIVVQPGASFSGRFVDSSGQPISGVGVQVVREVTLGMNDSFSIETSDGAGLFSVCSEVEADSDQSLSLLVFPEKHEKEVFQLLEEGVELGDLVLTPATRIFGTTRAPDGTPLAGVAVEIYSPERLEGDPPGRSRQRTYSGVLGQYEIFLPASFRKWELKADHRDFNESEVIDILAGEPGRELAQDLTLTAGGELQVLVTAGGLPVEGAQVELDVPWRFSRGVDKFGMSDSQGEIVFSGLSQGFYKIKVTKREFGSQTVDVDITAGEILMQEVALDPSRSLSGFVICEGIPVPSAEIRVRDISNSYRESRSEEDGSFRVDQLADGALRVDVSAEGCISQRVNGVSLNEGPLTVTLERSYVFEGLLYERNSREPVPRALIQFSQTERKSNRRIRSVRSDENGYFRQVNFRAGNYRVRITSNEYLPIDQMIELPIAQSLLEIPLDRGGEVYLQIMDQQGLPISGVRVFPQYREDRSRNLGRWVNQSTSERMYSNDSGELRIGGLEAGSIRFRTTHKDYISKYPVLELAQGSITETLGVTLTSGAEITGIVYLPNGEGIRGKTLICEGISGAAIGKRTERTSGRLGKFRFGQLVGGEYVLRLESGGTPVTVLLQAGQSIQIDLESGP